jgi:hypothetical protein
MNYIKESIIKTFPNFLILIKKSNLLKKKNIFDFCKDIQDDDIYFFHYSNPIFSFEMIGNKLIFKTKYLSPCMFLLNIFYKSYDLIDNNYHIEMNNLSPDINLYESDELIFNPKNLIPIEYIAMLIDFIDYDKNYLIKDIKLEYNQNDLIINLDYNNFLSNIDNLNISKEILIKSYMDYDNNSLNIELKILDSNWIILDPIQKFNSNNKNYSDIVEKFFTWIFQSNFTLFQNTKIFITTICKSEGGIDLTALFLSLGYSQIVDKNKNDYHDNYMRCCCNCYYCINRFYYNLSDGFHKNKYSGSNSDLLCVVIFNELLKKFGLVTELVINKQIYTNKSNNLLSDYYYWMYGFYNKKIEL